MTHSCLFAGVQDGAVQTIKLFPRMNPARVIVSNGFKGNSENTRN